MRLRQETGPIGGGLHARWDRWLRSVLFLYVFGSVIGAHSLFLFEFFWRWPFGNTSGVLLAALYVPLGVLGVGAWRLRLWETFQTLRAATREARRARVAIPFRTMLAEWRLTVVGLVMFGLWAGGYMAVGFWTLGRPTASLGLPGESAIPLVPEAVFVYTTVYPMVLLPWLLVSDHQLLRPMAVAYALVLLGAYATFLVYPVGFPRAAVPVTDFSTLILNVFYANDPPTNCFPSTHCAMSSLSAFCLYRIDRRFGWWAFAVAFAIGVSTLLTKQHYAIDVAAGWTLTLVAVDLAWGGPITRWARRLWSSDAATPV